MNTVHVLLGNSDRRLNNLIEVAVRDVCYDQLLVECSSTTRLDDLLHRGSTQNFGLIFITPRHLVTGPPRRVTHATIEQAAEVIRTIKANRGTPIIGVGISPDEELPLIEAGADNVFGVTFDRDELRAEIRRVLNLSELEEEIAPPPSRWSFATGLMRGLQKLTQS